MSKWVLPTTVFEDHSSSKILVRWGIIIIFNDSFMILATLIQTNMNQTAVDINCTVFEDCDATQMLVSWFILWIPITVFSIFASLVLSRRRLINLQLTSTWQFLKMATIPQNINSLLELLVQCLVFLSFFFIGE